MSDIFEKHFTLSSDAVASKVGDETVILQLKNGAYFGLNAIGTRIWELLKDGHSPAAICSQMAGEYDVTAEVVESDLRRLLSELEAKEIVIDAGRAGV